MSKTPEVPQQMLSFGLFVTRRCTNILVTTGVALGISVSVSIKLDVLSLVLSFVTASWPYIQSD